MTKEDVALTRAYHSLTAFCPGVYVRRDVVDLGKRGGDLIGTHAVRPTTVHSCHESIVAIALIVLALVSLRSS